jgi:uncharacterized protein
VITLDSFFEQARRGVLTAVRCQRCGELAMPPQERCRACRERAWAAVPLRGAGTVTSFTVRSDHRDGGGPDHGSAVVVVRLDEGVSVVGRVIDIPVGRLRVGMAVRFRPLVDGSQTAVGFGPA